jgi:hypothetical protein
VCSKIIGDRTKLPLPLIRMPRKKTPLWASQICPTARSNSRYGMQILRIDVINTPRHQKVWVKFGSGSAPSL